MKLHRGRAMIAKTKSGLSTLFMAVAVMPSVVMAQNPAEGKVKGFLTSVEGLLNIASLLVVTIAVIFAGYQIAFAHKRMADVAPVLIGGFLIGAAGQLAKMVLG